MSSDRTPDNGREAPDTRERLLDVAEQLFAEQGFEATSVRDITTAAGCNIASVNYHFGGKDNLYLESLRRLLREVREQRIRSIRADMAEAGDSATLELFLESFARSFIAPGGEQGRVRHLMAILDRELHNRRLPHEMFFEEMIRPMLEVTLEALAKVGPPLEPMTARLCVMFVVGQLIHALKIKHLLHSGEGADLVPHDPQAVIEHIVRFAAGGIRACAEEE